MQTPASKCTIPEKVQKDAGGRWEGGMQVRRKGSNIFEKNPGTIEFVTFGNTKESKTSPVNIPQSCGTPWKFQGEN